MKDKVVIITGASDGIGFATADRLAAEGAQVIMVARRPDRLEAATQRLRERGGRVEAAIADVTDGPALTRLIQEAASHHGRLDGLVNNAAKVAFGSIGDTTDETWRATFAAGADAVFVATRAALPIMQAQGSGAIVNISSTNGRRAMGWMGAYSASKAAIIHFSRVAAMEAAPYGVRVNAVAPGMVMTPGNVDFYAGQPDALAAVEAAIPAKRAGRPEELAAAIRFLLSNDSTYVNGTCLDVDGGKAAQLYMPA